MQNLKRIKMSQPIPKIVKEKNKEFVKTSFNTLLVDGSNLLEVCFAACKIKNSNGREIGAIFQFLLQLKILLQRGKFKYVYVLFDGENSGQLRYNLNTDYKANRDDKVFQDEEVSDYMKEVQERYNNMVRYFAHKKPAKTETEKENFMWQKDVLIDCLENLFIRVIEIEKTEADDIIGWYIANKKEEEKIVICSNDRDLTQLISNDVIVYIQAKHMFINTKNHLTEMGYSYENVLLKKMICGDSSDNIKGIKGVGETTFMKNFPEVKTKKVTLNEVIEKARKINEDRKNEKKKPLKWAENIVNRVTDGCQGEKIYEINEKIIDLKNPLMTDEAKQMVLDFMYAPLDPEGRTFENVYSILLEAGVDDLKEESKFSNFFIEYKYLINTELKNCN